MAGATGAAGGAAGASAVVVTGASAVVVTGRSCAGCCALQKYAAAATTATHATAPQTFPRPEAVFGGIEAAGSGEALMSLTAVTTD